MIRGLLADAAWRRRHANATARPSTKTAHRSAIRVALAIAVVLLLPLLAMQITEEVVWGPADFVTVGALVGGTGVVLELTMQSARNLAYRAAAGVALAAALLLIWLTLAVGIIGEPSDVANVMYLGVFAVFVAGTIIARLRPRGMAHALCATALAQTLVAVTALFAGKAQSPASSVSGIVGLNGFFVALFVGSAWLFRHAARRQTPQIERG
jgi:hypothetical protein